MAFRIQPPDIDIPEDDPFKNDLLAEGSPSSADPARRLP